MKFVHDLLRRESETSSSDHGGVLGKLDLELRLGVDSSSGLLPEL